MTKDNILTSPKNNRVDKIDSSAVEVLCDIAAENFQESSSSDRTRTAPYR